MKRVRKCMLEEEKPEPEVPQEEKKPQAFCFLKGLVDCNAGRIQDCNMKRVRKCPLENEKEL